MRIWRFARDYWGEYEGLLMIFVSACHGEEWAEEQPKEDRFCPQGVLVWLSYDIIIIVWRETLTSQLFSAFFPPGAATDSRGIYLLLNSFISPIKWHSFISQGLVIESKPLETQCMLKVLGRTIIQILDCLSLCVDIGCCWLLGTHGSIRSASSGLLRSPSLPLASGCTLVFST